MLCATNLYFLLIKGYNYYNKMKEMNVGESMKVKSKTTKLLLEILTIAILVVIVALSFLADLSFYNISECFLLRMQEHNLKIIYETLLRQF